MVARPQNLQAPCRLLHSSQAARSASAALETPVPSHEPSAGTEAQSWRRTDAEESHQPSRPTELSSKRGQDIRNNQRGDGILLLHNAASQGTQTRLQGAGEGLSEQLFSPQSQRKRERQSRVPEEELNADEQGASFSSRFGSCASARPATSIPQKPRIIKKYHSEFKQQGADRRKLKRRSPLRSVQDRSLGAKEHDYKLGLQYLNFLRPQDAEPIDEDKGDPMRASKLLTEDSLHLTPVSRTIAYFEEPMDGVNSLYNVESVDESGWDGGAWTLTKDGAHELSYHWKPPWTQEAKVYAFSKQQSSQGLDQKDELPVRKISYHPRHVFEESVNRKVAITWASSKINPTSGEAVGKLAHISWKPNKASFHEDSQETQKSGPPKPLNLRQFLKDSGKASPPADTARNADVPQSSAGGYWSTPHSYGAASDKKPEHLPSLQDWSSRWTSSGQSRDAGVSTNASRESQVERPRPQRSRSFRLEEEDEDEDEPLGKRRNKPRRAANIFEEEDDEWEFEDSLAERRRRKEEKKREKAAKTRAAASQVSIPSFISVSNLATALKTTVEAFNRQLLRLGFKDLANDRVLDAETAGLIARELNFEPVMPQDGSAVDLVALPEPQDKFALPPRPPVITIMGHVDHGKTTLLDWLRKSSVAATEHGGITQHIGAFTVNMPSGRAITFLDTPGHAAFLEMRARGANVTDIVILVVAADDSVKPQTIEAIKHAKAARVPTIVAINKMDKSGVDPDRVRQDLAQHGVEVEDFGGDTQTVPVSGKTGVGMEDLEEAAIALADILDLRADASGQVEGWVLEAASTKAGKMATILIRRGTLQRGDIIVAGGTWARARTLRNAAGVPQDSASPGTPIEVDGWRDLPEAGSEVIQAPDEQRARKVVDLRNTRDETQQLSKDVTAFNEARKVGEERRQAELDRRRREWEKLDPTRRPRFFKLRSRTTHAPVEEDNSEASKKIVVPFVVRADVAGSVEAVRAAVLALGNAEVQASVVRAAAGPLAPSDIEHAAIVGAHALAFNAAPSPEVALLAAREAVRIVEGSVIYRVLDDVKALLEERLAPLVTTRVLGEAEVAEVFEIDVKGTGKIKIAGCKVRNGVVSRSAKARVIRQGEVIHEGTYCLLFHIESSGGFHLPIACQLSRFIFSSSLPSSLTFNRPGSVSSLKSHKKDVTEMRKGTDCGLGFGHFEGFLIGDQVQCFEIITEKRKLA